MMIVLSEGRFLLKLNVYVQGPNQYYFRVMNKPGIKDLIVRTSREGLIKFLRKIQAKDTASSPRSFRKRTFIQMADFIIDGTDNEIWVWQHHWNPDTRKIVQQ